MNQPSDTQSVKIFSGLKSEHVLQDTLLWDMLDLNAEQLTHYLEDVIMDNPFVELEYSDAEHVAALERLKNQAPSADGDTSLQSLESYLFEQILLYRQTPIRDAMVQLVSLLDRRGYLPDTVASYAEQLDIPEIVVLDAITLIKQLEPAGVGAHDLQEAMLLQTERDHFAPNVAYYLLESFYNELSEQDYTEIQEQTDLSLNEIMECVNYYHMLRTSPASLFDQTARINVIPDVTVRNEQGELKIVYNRQYYPRLRFNQDYYDSMARRQDAELLTYIEEKAAHYHQLIDRLRQREELLMQIMQIVVAQQKDFFLGHTQERRPLSMSRLCELSRLASPIVYAIISNKNLAYHEQIYALTDFINMTLVKGRDGRTASNVKQRIMDIIQHSSVMLSDQEIVDLLADEHILISKDIVASYRKNLHV